MIVHVRPTPDLLRPRRLARRRLLRPPLPRRRSAPLVCAAVILALTLSACGASETNQVRAKVEQFATAANRHDYVTICGHVLGAPLIADIAAGGITCPKALSLALGSVRGARLVIGTITVSGTRASVLTASQAHGEQTALSTLELSKTSVGWRIESLGNAATGAA